MSDFKKEKEMIKSHLRKIADMDEIEIKEKYSVLEKTQEFHEVSRAINPNFKCEIVGCDVCLKEKLPKA